MKQHNPEIELPPFDTPVLVCFDWYGELWYKTAVYVEEETYGGEWKPFEPCTYMQQERILAWWHLPQYETE